jgi:hypothetical protein
MRLVKLAGNDRVPDQQFEWDDFEGVFVGGFEHDGTSGPGLLNLQPARGTDAPPVSWFETGKTKLRHGGAQVVAQSLRDFEETSIDDATDRVDAVVVGTSLAAAGAIEAGHRFAAADVEWLAENVLTAIFDGFNLGHVSILDR